MNSKQRKAKKNLWLETQYNPTHRQRELRNHLPMDMQFRIR